MLIIPTLVAFGFMLANKRRIAFKEFLIQIGVQTFLIFLFSLFIGWQNTHDVEVWNGRITAKKTFHVSCEHSYQCNCYTTCSGGRNGSCTTHCSTCYEHWYDVDWEAYTSNGETIDIDRIDRQGIYEPPRWTAIQIGEPTALPHSFTNYVKAAPNSLFRKTGLVEQYRDQIPRYPGNVYDYYHVNRFVAVNLKLPEQFKREFNQKLEDLNATLGRAKQVNIIVVMVTGMPEDYYYALEQSWIGGKKNDFIIVMNVNDIYKPTWVKAMAWSSNKMAEVVVADKLMQLDVSKGFSIDSVLDIAKDGIGKNFVRQPMNDYQYLSKEITPTLGQWIFFIIVGLIVSIGLGIFFLQNDFY